MVKVFKNSTLFSLEVEFSNWLDCNVPRSNILIVKYCKLSMNIKRTHSSTKLTQLLDYQNQSPSAGHTGASIMGKELSDHGVLV